MTWDKEKAERKATRPRVIADFPIVFIIFLLNDFFYCYYSAIMKNIIEMSPAAFGGGDNIDILADINFFIHHC
jgi:hypothetical protein